jgi:hypothetical protein
MTSPLIELLTRIQDRSEVAFVATWPAPWDPAKRIIIASTVRGEHGDAEIAALAEYDAACDDDATPSFLEDGYPRHAGDQMRLDWLKDRGMRISRVRLILA